MLTAKEFEFSYKLLHFGAVDILVIWKDKKIKMYKLTEFVPSSEFFGRAFRLEKIDEEHPAAEIRGDENHYNVLVSFKPFGCRCDCMGFSQYGYCRHVIACQDILIDEGEKAKRSGDTKHSQAGSPGLHASPDWHDS